MGDDNPDFTIETGEQGRRLRFRGAINVGHAAALDPRLRALRTRPDEVIAFNLKEVTALDTIGAWMLYRSMRDLGASGAKVSHSDAKPAHLALLEQVGRHDAPSPTPIRHANTLFYLIIGLGRGLVGFVEQVGQILSFLGLVLLRGCRATAQPRRIRWTSLFHHIEQTGWNALPIVGLLCFLIGLVIVQQGAEQLRQFGADVFVVNLIGISTLRELGVLLTAIILAGRSGSAFTAQIGAMKLHEEIDALETIGLDPVDTLVLPRMIALVIVMPLLTVYADVMALAGGALWAWVDLDIEPAAFIAQLHEAVDFTQYRIGVIKAPVFGVVIAVAGCFNGLLVAGGAASVGERTTLAVVQSIFMVIVLDAAFAIFFSAIGW